MAVAWIQDISNGATPVTSVAGTFAGNVTAGSLIVVVVRVGAVGRTLTVTDGLGNTYTQCALQAVGADHDTAIYKAYNVTGGACVVTLGISGAGSRCGIAAAEFSGAMTASDPQDDTATNTGADASVECGSVTMTADGAICVGWGYQSTQTTTLDSDYSNLEQNTTGRLGCCSRVTTAITDECLNTASASNNWSAVTATFKIPAAGGGKPYYAYAQQ